MSEDGKESFSCPIDWRKKNRQQALYVAMWAICAFYAIPASAEGAELSAPTDCKFQIPALCTLKTIEKNDEKLILLPKGTFHISRPITIIGASNVEIRAEMPGETKIFGSREYTLRKIRRGERIPAGINPELVRVIDADDDIRRLWKLSNEKNTGCAASSDLSIYQSGKRLSCARWPSNGYATAGRLISTNPSSLEFAAPVEKRNGWENTEGVVVAGYFGKDWFYELAPATYNKNGHTIRLSSLYQRYVAQPGFRYFIQGDISDLAKAGEYISDPSTDRVFVIPYDGTNTAEIPISDSLIVISNSVNVEITGINFSYAYKDGAVINNGREVSFNEATVQHVGGTGIVVNDGFRNEINSVGVTDTGGSGIVLSGGNRVNLEPALNSIDKSVIMETSRINKTYKPSVYLGGVGNALRNTFISDAPHLAIGLSGNDHVITGNEITRVVTETSDSGAIYAGRDWTWRGNKIEGNYIHDIKSSGNLDSSLTSLNVLYEVKGVYLDDMLSGTRVAYNVFSRVNQPVFVGGGRDNTIEGNLFVSPKGSAITIEDRSGTTPEVNDPASLIRKRLAAVPYAGDVYSERYPGMKQILNQAPGSPVGNMVVANAVTQGNLFESRKGGGELALLKGNMSDAWDGGNPTTLNELIGAIRSSSKKQNEPFRIALDTLALIDGNRVSWEKCLDMLGQNPARSASVKGVSPFDCVDCE